MVESSRLEEEETIEDNIIKDARNLFRLKKTKKEKNDSVIKDIKNLFTSKAENSAIKDRILRDIRNLFENKEEENYYVVLNMKVKVIEINHYQLKNILIKLGNT